MPHRLLLARHGQSTTNAENVFTGWSDPPLTAHGEEEARAMAAALARFRLRPRTIFSSSLSRARRTAEIIRDALDLEVGIICSDALNERDYGDLTGCNKAQIAERYGRAKLDAWRRSWSEAPPAGESLQDTAARVLPYYMREILPAVLERGSALVVAHGNSLRTLMIALGNVPVEAAPTVEIGTGAIMRYELGVSGRVERSDWLLRKDGVG